MPGTAEKASVWWRGLQWRNRRLHAHLDVVGVPEAEDVDVEPGRGVEVGNDQHGVAEAAVAGDEPGRPAARE